MVEITRLLDLFNREDYGKSHIIVVKNLPDNTHLDGIQNYLEVVTGKSLQSVCTRSGLGQTNILVAVLEEAVTDLNQIKDRQFEGRRIQFEYLGDVAGVLVVDCGSVSEEIMELYFENPTRSGGKQDTVEGVQIHEINETIPAVIQINDIEAIRGILSRQDHRIQGKTFLIEPYFPKFHDYLLEYMKNTNLRQQEKNYKSRPTISGNATSKRSKGKSNSENSEVSEYFVDERTKARGNSQNIAICNPIVQSKEVTNISAPAPLNKPSSKDQQSPLPDRSSKTIPVQSTLSNKLRLFIDDHEEIHAPSSFDLFTPTGFDLSVKHKQDHIPQSSADDDLLPKERLTSRKKSCCQDTFTLEEQTKQIVVELQNINRLKVILLKIGGIHRQCKGKKLKADICLQEQVPFVTLKGNDTNDLSVVEDLIKKMLSSVKQKSVKMSPKEKAYFLGRPFIQDFLRNKSKELKISVAFEMNVDEMELTLHAYHLKEIERGEQLVNESFTKETVNLTKEEAQVLKSQEWHDFKDKNNSKWTIYYEIDGKIIIESIVTKENMAAAKTSVKDFFKHFTPRDKTTIELNGGQAKYFQRYCQKGIEEFLRKKEARIYTEKKEHGSPLKLVLTVEGKVSCIEEVKKRINQIWHEKVDFHKLHVAEGDVWLIMRNLDGDIGRRFFRQFQLETKCVVEVLKEGEIHPPPLLIKQSRESRVITPIYSRKPDIETKSDSSDDTEDELQQFKQNQTNFTSESDNVEGTTAESSESNLSRLQNINLYQGGMNERAATAEAMKLSFIEYQRGESRSRESRDITSIFSRKPVNETKSDSSDDTEDELQQFKQNQTNFTSESDNVEGKTAVSSESNLSRLQNINLYQGGMNKRATIAKAMKLSFVRSQRRESRQLPEYSGEHTAEQRTENEITINQTRVVLMTGEIAAQKADALVNILDPSGEFPGQSVVSKAFGQKGGLQLKQILITVQRSATHDSDMVHHLAPFHAVRHAATTYNYLTITQGAGHLQCSDVIHVKLLKRTPQIITSVMNEIFQVCSHRGYRVISLPPLGIGRLYRYPVHQVASSMLKATKTCLMTGITQIQEVRIVVYKDDQETFRIFNRELNQVNQPAVVGYQVPVDLLNKQQSTLRKDQPYAASTYSKSQYVSHFSPHLKNSTPIYRSASQSKIEDGQRQTIHRPQKVAKGSFGQEQHRRTNSVSTLTTYDQRPEDKTIRHTRQPYEGARKHYQEERDRLNMTKYKPRESRLSPKQQHRDPGKHIKPTKEDKQKRKPPSRFQKESASSRLTVTVYAGDRDICRRLHQDLERKIKDEFLYEITLVRRSYVSEQAKQKIAEVVQRYKLKSVKGNKEYRLRGYKENVHKANEEILQVLLNDKPGDPTVERKRRRAAQPRRTLEFTKVMAVDEPEMPSYWKNFRPGETLNNLLVEMKHFLINRKYEKVQLKEDAPTYKAILRFINKTFEEGKGNIGQGKDASGIRQYSQCFVVKICRIENPELYALYAHKRTEIFRKLFTKQLGFFPRLENVMTGQHQRNLQPIQTVCLNQDRELTKDVYDEVNEYYFFHGTKPESIDKICSDGLDSRLCSPDAMFGQGIYGAESVVKADQYTDDKSNRIPGKKKMFLMRMSLGEVFVCQASNPHKFKRPPCTSCYKDDCKNKHHPHRFDSVVGGMDKLFREFVVYESKQCYPEYLITYERR